MNQTESLRACGFDSGSCIPGEFFSQFLTMRKKLTWSEFLTNYFWVSSSENVGVWLNQTLEWFMLFQQGMVSESYQCPLCAAAFISKHADCVFQFEILLLWKFPTHPIRETTPSLVWKWTGKHEISPWNIFLSSISGQEAQIIPDIGDWFTGSQHSVQ